MRRTGEKKGIIVMEKQERNTLTKGLLARLKKYYGFLKDNNGGKCEVPDCKNCPFPPCEIKG